MISMGVGAAVVGAFCLDGSVRVGAVGFGAVGVKLELSVYVGADAMSCLGVGAAVVRIFCLVAVWVGAIGSVRVHGIKPQLRFGGTAIAVDRLDPTTTTPVHSNKDGLIQTTTGIGNSSDNTSTATGISSSVVGGGSSIQRQPCYKATQYHSRL